MGQILLTQASMVKQVNSLRSFLRFTNWMSQPGYRSKQEEAQWKERDPLESVPGKLKQRSLLTDEQSKRPWSSARTRMDRVRILLSDQARSRRILFGRTLECWSTCHNLSSSLQKNLWTVTPKQTRNLCPHHSVNTILISSYGCW